MNKKIKNIILSPLNLLYRISPVFEQKLIYRLKMKKGLDLKDPESYSEKINWLKLYNKDPKIIECADKYLVRNYITERGLGEYLPKLLWQGDDPEKIPFDKLPDAYVVKSNTGSGNNYFVRSRADEDRNKIISSAKSWLKEKYLLAYGEWHYMKIKPCIIIEELLSDGKNDVPIDYKFFCFNNYGNERKTNVGCVAVDLNRYVHHVRNIYDSDFNMIKGAMLGIPTDNSIETEKPRSFDLMKEIAVTLAEPFPTCRVDFYEINGRPYVGEITFFDNAGYGKYFPESLNLKMGSWVDLSPIK